MVISVVLYGDLDHILLITLSKFSSLALYRVGVCGEFLSMVVSRTEPRGLLWRGSGTRNWVCVPWEGKADRTWLQRRVLHPSGLRCPISEDGSKAEGWA